MAETETESVAPRLKALLDQVLPPVDYFVRVLIHSTLWTKSILTCKIIKSPENELFLNTRKVLWKDLRTGVIDLIVEVRGNEIDRKMDKSKKKRPPKKNYQIGRE